MKLVTIKSLLNTKAKCGEPFTDEEIIYDYALNCQGKSQRDIASRWGWPQTRVSRQSKFLIHAAVHIIRDYESELNHFESKQAETEANKHVLNHFESNVGENAITKERERKNEEKKEKVTQKERKEVRKKEKETSPPIEKNSYGVKKETPPLQKLRFRKPSLEEVCSYFAEYAEKKGFSIDPADEAEAWYDHKEGNGWKVGRTPMKDWKATVRTWLRTDYGKKKPDQPKPVRQYDDEANMSLARLYAM